MLKGWLPPILQHGPQYPIVLLAVFFLASALMIWRLGALEKRGFEGTVLGTLVMPFCSGLSNLIFAWVVSGTRDSGRLVLENCVVNNVTNLTLLIGLPALVWGMSLQPEAAGGDKGKKAKPAKPADKAQGQLTRLSILLSLTAAGFFIAAVWVLARKDRVLNQTDGLVLVGVFLFWQAFHVFDVLKAGVREKRKYSFLMVFDLALIGLGAFGVYQGVDLLVAWVNAQDSGLLGPKGLGWLSGWLMVLPNAMLALYYSRAGRADIAYSSQVGDGHICIPLCLGVFACFQEIRIPKGLESFDAGLLVLAAAVAAHFAFMAVLGRIPRFVGGLLLLAYAWFVYRGLPV